MGNPLLDKDFLRELDLKREKEIYARLTSLDINERPIEHIEGRVTGGSINIDGTSIVRRTCNLTLFSQDVNINDFYWGLNTKFKVEIGVKNTINSNYPEIIWFKQGIYLITTFNTSISATQCNISISGKDKGCMLNGDVSGNLPASIDFGKEEFLDKTYEPITLTEKTYKAYQYYLYNNQEYVLDTGLISAPTVENPDGVYGFNENTTYYKQYIASTKTDLKLKDIILQAVHFYAKEPFENIIINDLEDYGLELLEYKGDKNIYFLRSMETGVFEHMVTDETIKYYLSNDPDQEIETDRQLSDFDNPADHGIVADSRVDGYQSVATPVYFYTESTQGTRKVWSWLNRRPMPGEECDDVRYYHGQPIAWHICVGTEPCEIAHFTNAYTVAVIHTGETTGYRMTDLVYNGELISNVGETLSSMLDKIKNMLGDFEYFYDIDGHFIFQRKKTFINTAWNSIITSNDERFAVSMAETSACSYSFEGNTLVTALQHSPVLNNLKNDYSIWGKRKGVSGADIPIHLRYAIHKKPTYYKAFDGKIYTTDLTSVEDVLQVAYSEIVAQYKSDLTNFNPQHINELPLSFKKPTKLANGLWTPGWWDIRDWATYYKLINGTQEDPCGTMKFYSQNDLTGCVPIASLYGFPIAQRYMNGYAWLAVASVTQGDNGERRYNIDFGHGYGVPSSATKTCTYYESHRDNDQEPWVTSPTDPVRTEQFIAPYNGCNDSHTYQYFLTSYVDRGMSVYFYNPKFPKVESTEIAIEEHIQEMYENFLEEGSINLVDWREIIYQMAKDYYQYNTDNDFTLKLRDNNRKQNGDYVYPTGYTGYESYYSDMQGFWRQIYCPTYDEKNLNIRYEMADGNYQRVRHIANEETGTYTENLSEYVEPTVEAFTCDFYLPEEYKTDVIEPELDNRGGWHIANVSSVNCHYESYFNDDYAPWARNVIDNPAALNFWIDFLDTGELGEFDVTAVGNRPKVVNDNDVRSIYNKEVPDMIFVSSDENFALTERKTGYTYCKLNSSMENLFSISAMGKSAKEKLDELLYQFSYCIENITITSIPIYYLEPNTRIFVHDDKSNIDGDFIVTKFTIPLTYNGTMSITANKAPQRIY